MRIASFVSFADSEREILKVDCTNVGEFKIGHSKLLIRRPAREADDFSLQRDNAKASTSRFPFNLLNDDRVIIGLATLCIVLSGFLLITFHFNRPQVPFGGDGLYELASWLRGETFWQKLHHNGAALWFSALGLYLDLKIGPYGVWSLSIGYVLLFVFLMTFAKITADRFGAIAAALFISTFTLLWVQHFNLAQTYTYYWRIPEVGSLMATIALGAWLIFYNERLSNIAWTALLGLAFVFSNTHGGYVPFALTLLALAFLSNSRRAQIKYLTVLIAYIAYMFFVDGSFLGMLKTVLTAKASATAPASHFGIANYPLGLIALITQAGPGLLHTPAGVSLVLRILLFILFAGLCLHALKSFWRQQDRWAAIFLLVACSQIGIAALAVVARVQLHGIEKIASVPRYFSYPLVLLLISALYASALLNQKYARVPLVILSLVGIIHTHHTLKTFDHVYVNMATRSSVNYSIALNGDSLPPPPSSSQREQRELLFVLPHLQAYNSADFGRNVWHHVLRLEKKRRPTNLAKCNDVRIYKNRESRTRQTRYSVYVLNLPVKTQLRADFAIAIASPSKIVALAQGFRAKDRQIFNLYVPDKVGQAELFLGKTSSQDADLVCSVILSR